MAAIKAISVEGPALTKEPVAGHLEMLKLTRREYPNPRSFEALWDDIESVCKSACDNAIRRCANKIVVKTVKKFVVEILSSHYYFPAPSNGFVALMNWTNLPEPQPPQPGPQRFLIWRLAPYPFLSLHHRKSPFP